MPVKLIATPRSEFLTCVPTDLVGDVIRAHHDIDHLPVVEEEGSERIIGLFHAHRATAHAADLVESHFSKLAEEHLIGAEAAIIDFIHSADRHSCRMLVLDMSICGLVTLSDLQALPVRVAIFALLTELEMRMMDVIRAEFQDGMEWLERLAPHRRQAVQNDIARAKAGDAFVDPLYSTRFADKAAITAGAASIHDAEIFAAAMRAARDLRNRLAHASHYASTREEGLKLCQTVREISAWIEHLVPRQEKQ